MWCVSGSRDFDNYGQFKKALQVVINELGQQPTFVHVGDCRGVDAMMVKWCRENEINYKIYKADWSLGSKAGPIRNRQMIDALPDDGVLVAFPSPFSKGTRSAIKIAKARGIKQAVVELSMKMVKK